MEENIEKRIGFLGYIKSFFKNYVNFKGTASKRDFWMSMLILYIICPICILILGSIIGWIISLITHIHSIFSVGIIAWAVYYFGITIPIISITCRRINDTGRDGLLGLIPWGVCLLGSILPYFLNPWRYNVEEASLGLMGTCSLIGLIILIVLCTPSSGAYKKDTMYSDSKTSNPNNTTDELIKMKELLDKGILTQEEFDEQKKKILNK